MDFSTSCNNMWSSAQPETKRRFNLTWKSRQKRKFKFILPARCQSQRLKSYIKHECIRFHYTSKWDQGARWKKSKTDLFNIDSTILHLLKGSQNILYLLQKSLSNAFQLHISQHPVENIQIAFDDLIYQICSLVAKKALWARRLEFCESSTCATWGCAVTRLEGKNCPSHRQTLLGHGEHPNLNMMLVKMKLTLHFCKQCWT